MDELADRPSAQELSGIVVDRRPSGFSVARRRARSCRGRHRGGRGRVAVELDAVVVASVVVGSSVAEFAVSPLQALSNRASATSDEAAEDMAICCSFSAVRPPGGVTDCDPVRDRYNRSHRRHKSGPAPISRTPVALRTGLRAKDPGRRPGMCRAEALSFRDGVASRDRAPVRWSSARPGAHPGRESSQACRHRREST